MLELLVRISIISSFALWRPFDLLSLSFCLGNWQQRFMGVPHSLGESGTSVYGHSTTSLRTWTPQSQVRRDSITPTASSSSPAPSDLSHSSSSSIRPIILGTTDLDVFETSLEYFYTGGREAEAFAVVLEGFNEGGAAMEDELTGTAKLRQVC